MILSPGFQADARTLHKVLQQRYVQYQFNHRRPMSVSALAQLLGNTLYYKRFFPYYTFNLCAGLDDEGNMPVMYTLV
jgi:20S proteasome subunit beta 6